MKIKIIGAGSAGNHIAYALTTLREIKEITITDISKKALLRSKNQIFIKRYGKWSKKLKLELESENIKKRNFYDGIVVSSPPEYHKKNIQENISKSNNFLIEKPLCSPKKSQIDFFKKIKKKYNNKIFLSGYNHRLFPSTIFLKKKIKREKVLSCNVSFKENIGGFLKAHNWMKSINESYLSKTKLGGGALCEHSHALNLVQYFIKHKNIQILSKQFKFNKDKKNYHDLSFGAQLKLDKTMCEFEQNFTTLPVEKIVTIFTNKKIYKLIYNFENNNDCILINDFKNIKKYKFTKKRKDDFIYEAKYFINVIKKVSNSDILNVDHGIKTMEIILKLINKIKLN